MQIKKSYQTPTKMLLSIDADQSELKSIKQTVLRALAADRVKVAGFRAGKAPLDLIEKQVSPHLLQDEFLQQAISRLYTRVLQQEGVRPVAQPEVTVKKFVPFDTLQFEASVDAVGEVKLGDYKHLKVAKEAVSVTAKDVNDVLKDLQTRTADKKDVTRAGRTGDQLIIDFKGTDAQTKEPVAGADGKNYPLLLGSNTFIPGFESHLEGLKAGAKHSFTLTFPKDYGVKALQSREVSFEVTVHKVQEANEQALDDGFAQKIGPFKTLAELKTDVKKQLIEQRQREAEQAYESELVNKLAKASVVAIPDSLIEEQLDQDEQAERQNLAYKGQTWQEHLVEEGVTEQQHRDRQRETAEFRVKAGIVLSEVAEAEGLKVSPEEVETRITLLKGQYSDAQMQAELDKPEAQRNIASRLLTEKTVARLIGYNTSNEK